MLKFLDKNDCDDMVSSGDRIVMAHDKLHIPRSEISAALAKKYDGKSREVSLSHIFTI